jgi:hypothetical protein
MAGRTAARATAGCPPTTARPPTDALPTDALPTDALPTDALPTDALPTDALPRTGALPDEAPGPGTLARPDEFMRPPSDVPFGKYGA